MYEGLRESVREFPDRPGVYLMKDEQGTVIYVGKAKELRKRVSSYFTGNQPIKTRVLVSKIGSIEYILTSNEYEALLLENNLIKKWNPRYNINLKDGKTYPVIKVTGEDFPRIYRTRRIIQDGSQYYGPFADVTKIDMYLELIEKLFPLRKCKGALKKREHPCLYYHIGRCAAPCAGKIDKEAYNRRVEEARKLLSGETAELEQQLEETMAEQSRQLDFEKAAETRDLLEAVRTVGAGQEVVDFEEESRDYIGSAKRDTLCSFNVLQMRGGKMMGRDLYRAESYGSGEEALTEFFIRYYTGADKLPQLIYTSDAAEASLLERFFREEFGAEVTVRVPEEGRHQRILNMAVENAKQDAERRLRAVERIPALEDLQEVLSLSKLPRRIEGFDIAQLSGTNPVASLVSFYNGNPDKARYRRFHIKSLQGKVDDYEAIREVVARRYTRLLNEQRELPDLVVIDGGKGQVNAARQILDDLGLGQLPVVGLAKKLEEIYTPGDGEPVRLPEGTEALRVLQAVRDETHRFATGFNKALRKKGLNLSTLEGIDGIGPKRSKALLSAFGSIAELAAADPEEVAGKTGIPRELAERLKGELQDMGEQSGTGTGK
jgi:excinuclease ABC subunit C